MKRLMTFGLFLAIALHGQMHAQQAKYPLDPLTWQEYWRALEILQEAGRLDADTRFSMVNLIEPPKAFVLQWSPGEAIPRTAFAIVRQGERTFESRIDLIGHRVISWKEMEGVQPNFLSEEFESISDAVKSHPDVIAALDRRGFDDLTFIDCVALPPGYFGTDEQRNRRIGHVMCIDARGVRNSFSRKIEGLTVVVDMHDHEVIRVVDEGVVSLPESSADFDSASIGQTRPVPGPMRVEQALGPGFQIDGYQVSWQKWRFHVRPDQRVGMVISNVTYQEGEEMRQVLYQGHLSEIFVPYMDPGLTWYPKNFLDAGEYSVGGLCKPLMQGLDCPDHAVYLNALVAEDSGRPKAVPRVIGLFEREMGDMAWRHWDELAGEGLSESRVKRDLVVRAAAVLGNYDYVFDWIFQQDGSIRIAVGSTGIAEAKTVAQHTATSDTGENGTGNSGNKAPADAYGRFVDRQIVAVNHSHYFNFRLDLDVDGPTNTLRIDRLRTETLPEDHPRRSVWVLKPMFPAREADAKLNIKLNTPALWRVLSESRTNHVGYPASYQLMPCKSPGTLMTTDDYPRRRAGFIDHHLWVTPYDPNERYAAGDYPTLSKPGYGLPAWTSKNRSIENTDIVLWHTIGMHHVVRAEDWPVMPVLWHGFELRPFDFFDRNPALDLPR